MPGKTFQRPQDCRSHRTDERTRSRWLQKLVKDWFWLLEILFKQREKLVRRCFGESWKVLAVAQQLVGGEWREQALNEFGDARRDGETKVVPKQGVRVDRQ